MKNNQGDNPLAIRSIAAILPFVSACLCCSRVANATDADKPSITPALVCQVQNAIRHLSPAWGLDTCERVSAALNATPSPRTTLAIAVLESDLRPRAVAKARPGVRDVGLLGVRCVLSNGRCTNGPARGHTVAELQDPVVNIRVASAIMVQKKLTHGRHWLRGYNGGTRERGYAARVGAIEAALAGEVVRVKSARVRKLVRQIVPAVNNGRKI